ncbi:hypothetical protein CN677_01800 [Bacillus pseudomycoides]|uniref:hypothetical protein n=1 Tax=Bacillus pseudomycoides TaxID=64104 RepID=UPI000BF237EF|nr:hypothetical protein [Bacillus pseudomycoides]PEJ40018.1 hypothetical protein CN677_01800 [Bacillus pseudomycoides]
MFDQQKTSKVVLPSWCWKGARSKSEVIWNAEKYITPKRYPGYTILDVEEDFAICEREEM